jgi:hypothetical protein
VDSQLWIQLVDSVPTHLPVRPLCVPLPPHLPARDDRACSRQVGGRDGRDGRKTTRNNKLSQKIEGFERGALDLAVFLLSLAPATSGWMDMVAAIEFGPQGSKQGWVEATGGRKKRTGTCVTGGMRVMFFPCIP